MVSTQQEITFEPVQTHRTFEVVCSQIRAKLANGELRPGDKLPAERLLATQLNVSRSAIREALRSLEVAGVVRMAKGIKGGAFIREGTSDRIAEVIQDLVHLGAISLTELTEARLALYEGMVPLACDRASEEQFAALVANVDRLAEEIDAGRKEKRPDLAYEFYHLLGECTLNSAIIYLNDSLAHVLRQYALLIMGKPGMPGDELVGSRRRFLKHMRDRNAQKAMDELRRHLRRTHKILWEGR